MITSLKRKKEKKSSEKRTMQDIKCSFKFGSLKDGNQNRNRKGGVEEKAALKFEPAKNK